MKQESIEAVGAKVAAGVTYAGIRALARLLINYKDKHGLTTITGIITR